MKKHSWQTARFRRVTTAAVLAFASLAVACDESTGPGGVVGVDLVIVPIGTSPSNIVRGTSVQLVAAPHDANDQFVNTPITWSSSNTNIATVDANGLVTGVEGATAGGDVTITAAAGGHSATFDLNFQRPIASVAIAPAAPTVRREGAVTLSATVLDLDGNPAVARTVTWTSSSTATARFGTANTATSVTNANGVATASVSGVADGTTTITATAENNEVTDVSGTRNVVVAGAPLVATVTVTPPLPFYGVGQTVQLSQTSRAGSGTVVPGTTANWSSSANGVATVDANGLVTIVGAGTATISAVVDNGEGTNITGTTIVTGAATPVTQLTGGVAATVPDVAATTAQYFAIQVPAGASSLTINLSGGSGDADLYVFDRGFVLPAPNPDPNLVAWGSNGGARLGASASSGNTESVVIATPAAGIYRIAVFAWGPAGTVSGASITATIGN